MRYRALGRTGLSVSELSFGAVEIGMDYGIPGAGDHGRPSEENAARLLNRVLDLGINYIDTARAYGESEAVIGRAIASRRAEYVLCTKVLPKESRDEIEASLTESLRSLRTEAVDILMIHSAPASMIETGLAAEHLLRLKERGWFRFLGASVYGEDAALAAIDAGVFDCLQIAYSMLDRRPEAKTIPAAQKAGVGLVARSVLLKGALSHRYRALPDVLDPLKQQVERFGELVGAHLPEAAYRYVLARDVPETVLVGTANVAEVEAAVEYAAKGPLPAETVQAIAAEPLLTDYELNPGKWPPL
ncbi:MAG: aldo/keto reductase [Bryobacterales bacterium]|nr:aldo/keto reductase [Bryobacterales bacterium]